MTSMDDPDLGAWSYVYNRHSQLLKQKDGRNVSTCHYFDSLARLVGKEYTSASECPTTPATYHVSFNYGTSGTATGQLTQSAMRYPPAFLSMGINKDEYYSKTVSYDTQGQVSTEVVYNLNWAPLTTTYEYDGAGRVETIGYPDGEQVGYGYNGMGLHSAITSSVHSIIVDGVGYDVLGRVSASRYPTETGSIYLTNEYHPWVNGTSNDSNLRLKAILAGTQSDVDARMQFEYVYDSFGNIKQFSEEYNGAGGVVHEFAYDEHNRLTTTTYNSPTSVVHGYTFRLSNRPNIFEGKQCCNAPAPTLACRIALRACRARVRLPDDRGRALGAQQVLADEFNCLSPYSDAMPEDCRELRFMVAEGDELERQFKAPSLRNVAERAPYMHAGQFGTLELVLAHYNTAPKAPAGHSEVEPLQLSETEMNQLVAFLHTLSGPIDSSLEAWTNSTR